MSEPVYAPVKNAPVASFLLGVAPCGLWMRVAGSMLLLGLCAFALQHFGYANLVIPWTRTTPTILSLALVLQMLSYAARAARLAQSEAEIGWSKFPLALRLVLLHNATNLLLPMRSGELSFPFLMHRWVGIDPVRAGGVLMFLRLADVQVLACMGLVAVLSLWRPSGSHLWIVLGSGLALAAPLLLWKLALRVRRRILDKPWVLRLAQGAPTTVRELASGLAWTWLAWTLKLCGLALLFADLANAPFALGLLVALGGDASSVLPIHAPAGVGTYEAGALLLAAPWAVVSKELVASVMGLHAFILSVALALGALAALIGRSRPARAASGSK